MNNISTRSLPVLLISSVKTDLISEAVPGLCNCNCPTPVSHHVPPMMLHPLVRLNIEAHTHNNLVNYLQSGSRFFTPKQAAAAAGVGVVGRDRCFIFWERVCTETLIPGTSDLLVSPAGAAASVKYTASLKSPCVCVYLHVLVCEGLIRQRDLTETHVWYTSVTVLHSVYCAWITCQSDSTLPAEDRGGNVEQHISRWTYTLYSLFMRSHQTNNMQIQLKSCSFHEL